MQFAAQCQSYGQDYPRADFLIVQLGGRPVGRFYVDRQPDEILIMDIIMLPGEAVGIGRKLIRGIFAEAEAAGKPVRGQVEWGNPAMRLFQRMGFRITGSTGAFNQVEWLPGSLRA